MLVSILRVMGDQLMDHPLRMLLEIVFISIVAYVLLHLRKTKKARGAGTSKYTMPSLEEQERRLAAFTSRVFHEDSKITSNVPVPDYKGMYNVQSRDGWQMTVTGGGFADPTVCMDLATFDFHSLSTHPNITELARKTVVAYGVGSCGPRGFYGTVKPHVVLEEDLARFCGTDDAIIYSFGYATIATLISCYASRGDYLVMDEGVSPATEEGCVLTRSNLSRYAHNDMADLERKLQAVAAKDDPNKPKRRFVVAEGVFKKSGDIANLPDIMALCDKHKFRLILEDSYGFGALGKTGRGTPEHFGIPISKVDIYVGSLSTSLGAVGGFCAGDSVMIDFQRLGAAAYVFSASLPPYVTACSSAALAMIENDPSLTVNLNKNTRAVRAALREANFSKNKIGLVECADDASPLVVLAVGEECTRELGREMVESKLQRVVNSVKKNKIIILRNLFEEKDSSKDTPSLKIVVKSQIPESELKGAVDAIVNAIKAEFA